MSKILSETAFDEIVLALPSVHYRANLIAHCAVMNQQLRELQAQKSIEGSEQQINELKDQLKQAEITNANLRSEIAELRVRAEAQEAEKEREKIVQWLLETNKTDTVRAVYARKLAGLIQEARHHESPN